MPNYKGRRPGTRRVVIWVAGKPREWIIRGSKKDADKFEARKRLEIEERGNAEEHRSSPSISKLCDLYAVHAQRVLRSSTWKRSRTYQLARVRKYLGHVQADQITTEILEDFRDMRLETVRPATLNNELDALSAALRWARKAGYPVSTLKIEQIPDRLRPRVKVWTDDEVERIFAAARQVSSKLLRMILLGLNSGMRKGEIIAMEWSWIDESRELICIPATDEWAPKSGKAREIPMGDAVKAALAGEHENPRWVFPNRVGGKRRWFPQRWWDDAMKIAGTKGHPHMMRHTFASHFLKREPDLFLLSKILGHGHTQTTLLYAHLLPEHLEKGRNAVRLLPQTMAVPVGSQKESQDRAKKARKKG